MVKGGEATNVVTSKTRFTQTFGKSDDAEWGGWETPGGSLDQLLSRRRRHVAFTPARADQWRASPSLASSPVDPSRHHIGRRTGTGDFEMYEDTARLLNVKTDEIDPDESHRNAV
jgi:hypothetical protein